MNQRILLGRRHEHGAIAYRLHAMEGGVVAIGPEEDPIIAGTPDVNDQSGQARSGRSRRTSGPAPGAFAAPVNTRSLMSRNACSRRGRCTWKRSTRSPSTLVLTGRVGVTPRHVVLRRGPQHGHIVPLARCSAIVRQCASDPPVTSVPYRWTTHASLIGAAGALRRRPGQAPGRAAQRVDVLPQPGILDRERLEAREQHEVHLVLPAKVLARVLVEPAVQRQENTALQEQERTADHRPVRRQAQRRVDPPLLLVGQQLGQQQLAAIACLEAAPETRETSSKISGSLNSG